MKKRLAAMALALSVAVSMIPAEPVKAGVTKASDLVNPYVSQTVGQTVWDCIYFGGYWQTKFVPVHAPVPAVEEQICQDADGSTYLEMTDGLCYRYEPIKWRVLQIDGTDAFVMADKSLDQRAYHDTDLEKEGMPEAVWADCDLRNWLNDTGDKGFMGQAFTAAEQNAIKLTTVTNEDNPWSGLEGGEDTRDRVYLLSIDEALNPSYGFSSDPKEIVSRMASNTDYLDDGGMLHSPVDLVVAGYWLRSPGPAEYYPAYVGVFGDAFIQTERTVHNERQVGVKAIRPVMHIDLSDTSLWSYAGRVTSAGKTVVEPEETGTVKKPGKPTIKSVKSTKAKTAKLTLKSKVSGASGYQVQYATNKKFTGAKSKKFSSTSVTITGLSKKTWYFRVRAYAKGGGKTVYGKWSAVKKTAVKGASATTYKTAYYTIKLPAEWDGNYIANEWEDDGRHYLSFHEKSCYEELDGEGGWLFSIGVYSDKSYEDMPDYEIIKKKGNKTYVATFPTDVQFYGASDKAVKRYQKMSGQIGTVLGSFKLR